MQRRVFVMVLGLLLIAIDPRWLHEIGITRAAVNAALLMGTAFLLLKSLQDRFTPL